MSHAIVAVKADVNELKKIEAEIRRLNDLIKPLRKRKKEIEGKILTFMQSTGQQGLVKLKTNDIEVVAVEKTIRERVTKAEKEATAIQLLQQSGVQNPKKCYRDLQEMLKGKENVTQALKVKSNTG